MEEIILQHYDELKTRRIRGGYYIVGDYLAQRLKEGRITEQEYNHFLSEQGYATYRDDLWTSLEKKYGLERPEAKPLGVIYTLGEELPIEKFDEVYYRARGFIFVEKADEAEDLSELSFHGWAIIAGQGFSTRLMRQLFKQDGRPVLALHDCDTAGEWIYRVFDMGSKRTKHLQLNLENVIDLGLHEEDAIKLGLPPRPEAKKYQKYRRERFELSALAVLKTRYGVENPVLAYTVAKMKKMGIRITPTPEELRFLLRYEIKSQIRRSIKELVDKLYEIVELPSQYQEEIAENLSYPDGEAIEVIVSELTAQLVDLKPIEELKTRIQQELEKIKLKLIEEAQKAVDDAKIIDEDEYERRVVDSCDANRIISALEVKP
ncbi:hypothetical protein DRP05_01025 [Archaeoglobales archaeon]|nr:MAG: hypothetical protein DRP05_01025 [Archaeoglobales archaeon]